MTWYDMGNVHFAGVERSLFVIIYVKCVDDCNNNNKNVKLVKRKMNGMKGNMLEVPVIVGRSGYGKRTFCMCKDIRICAHYFYVKCVDD